MSETFGGRHCKHCGQPLPASAKLFCNRKCTADWSRCQNRLPRPYDDRMRELAALGMSIRAVAAEMGIGKEEVRTRFDVLGLERVRKVPSNEQIEILKALYPDRSIPISDVIERINAVSKGYRITCARNLFQLARNRKIKRNGTAQTKPKAASKTAPPVGGARPRTIPLWRLVGLARELGVPRSLVTDVVAVSRAQRRADPSHPGYVLETRDRRMAEGRGW